MKNLPSPSTAERNQQRKLSYLPPFWSLLLVLAAIVLIVVVTR
jgi:hypothetical protein